MALTLACSGLFLGSGWPLVDRRRSRRLGFGRRVGHNGRCRIEGVILIRGSGCCRVATRAQIIKEIRFLWRKFGLWPRRRQVARSPEPRSHFLEHTLILIGLSRFAWASAVPLSGTRKRMKKAPFLGEKSPAHTLDKRVSERGAERI
jgi:hypothetical protein